MISEGFRLNCGAIPWSGSEALSHSEMTQPPQYLMLASVKVNVTGTNYQCQIIMVKKCLMQGQRPNTDKSSDIKLNA